MLEFGLVSLGLVSLGLLSLGLQCFLRLSSAGVLAVLVPGCRRAYSALSCNTRKLVNYLQLHLHLHRARVPQPHCDQSTYMGDRIS